MHEVKTFKDDDLVRMVGKRQTWSFGTISGYAAKYGETHLATDRIAKAVRLGHNVVWLNAQATVISDPPSPREEIAHYVQDREVVFVDSIHGDERGYWQVLSPGWSTGDNAQMVRPMRVYEVWDNNVGKDSFVMLLKDEISQQLSYMLSDNPHCQINIVAHFPNEYTKSGFAEDD
jgi:hypothetical protein